MKEIRTSIEKIQGLIDQEIAQLKREKSNIETRINTAESKAQSPKRGIAKPIENPSKFYKKELLAKKPQDKLSDADTVLESDYKKDAERNASALKLVDNFRARISAIDETLANINRLGITLAPLSNIVDSSSPATLASAAPAPTIDNRRVSLDSALASLATLPPFKYNHSEILSRIKALEAILILSLHPATEEVRNAIDASTLVADLDNAKSLSDLSIALQNAQRIISDNRTVVDTATALVFSTDTYLLLTKLSAILKQVQTNPTPEISYQPDAQMSDVLQFHREQQVGIIVRSMIQSNKPSPCNSEISASSATHLSPAHEKPYVSVHRNPLIAHLSTLIESSEKAHGAIFELKSEERMRNLDALNALKTKLERKVEEIAKCEADDTQKGTDLTTDRPEKDGEVSGKDLKIEAAALRLEIDALSSRLFPTTQPVTTRASRTLNFSKSLQQFPSPAGPEIGISNEINVLKKFLVELKSEKNEIDFALAVKRFRTDLKESNPALHSRIKNGDLYKCLRTVDTFYTPAQLNTIMLSSKNEEATKQAEGATLSPKM